jgi:hypothetical protein
LQGVNADSNVPANGKGYVCTDPSKTLSCTKTDWEEALASGQKPYKNMGTCQEACRNPAVEKNAAVRGWTKTD